MSESTQGMRVVLRTYSLSGELQGESSFHVDDDIDVINEMDNVERFLFDQYEQFLEGAE